MIYVLDACALVALFKQEDGFEKVRDLIQLADTGHITIHMSIINVLEVYYGFAGSDGFDAASVIINKIFNSSIHIIETISRSVFNEAARLKARYKCSLADAVGIALAVTVQGIFVTADHHELEDVEKAESIPFLWFR